MLRFVPNLTMLFNDMPFLDRFEAAANAGFRHVEFLFPYDFSIEQIEFSLRGNNLVPVLFNLFPGDWSAGERGIGIFSDRMDDFKKSVQQAIDYATATNCKKLHVMSGILQGDRTAAVDIYKENLAYAAGLAKPHGIDLMIEPLNKYDVPNYLISYQAQAVEIIDDLQQENIRLQMDLYHLQIMEGNLAKSIEKYFDYIGHIQIAGNPGRHEPDIGEINYAYIFCLLKELGYKDFIGCEYHPKGGTLEGLDWIKSLN
ncbi:MAG: 2-oxo-tetronate isomerase [Alphaproteobacteria bacterium]|nr:2-oxo-tetronate isomerase [Alphaproteobacteria bacterium]